jgi:hypothetical protein
VRETLQASFALYNNNAKPDIEDEGSNVLLNLLYAPMAAAGNFKMPPDEKITPYIEDPALPTRRRNQRLADGTQATYEDAIAPWLEDQLRRKWRIFSTSLKMCLSSHYHVPKLKVPFAVIDDLYSFLLGREMLGSAMRPTPQVLDAAHYAFWRKVSLDVHKGTTIEASITTTKQDALFWIREVYNHSPAHQGKAHRGKGQGQQPGKGHGSPPYGKGPRPKQRARSAGSWAPQGKNWAGPNSWPSPSKGGGKPAKPGKPGKGKPGKPGKGNGQQLATHDHSGRKYCNEFQRYGTCTRESKGQPCPDSHNCAAMRADWSPCDGTSHQAFRGCWHAGK